MVLIGCLRTSTSALNCVVVISIALLQIPINLFALAIVVLSGSELFLLNSRYFAS